MATENDFRIRDLNNQQANAKLWFIQSRTAMLAELKEELNKNIARRKGLDAETAELRQDYDTWIRYNSWIQNIEDIWVNRAKPNSVWKKAYSEIENIWCAAARISN